MAQATPTPIDGRRARSERSKAAIIDAALALIREGILVPTAQQISDRAGIGIRTFFRHFEDMEAIFTACDARMRASYEGLFSLDDRTGSIEERVDRVVGRYADAYERLKNMARSTRAQLWRSEVLVSNYQRNQLKLRGNLEKILPELKDLPDDRREAIYAIASFEMWDRLRAQQGLTKKASIGIVSGLLKDLIA